MFGLGFSERRVWLKTTVHGGIIGQQIQARTLTFSDGGGGKGQIVCA